MARELKTWAFWRAVLAELLGMTLFIFIGISAAIGNKHNADPDQEVKVALAFGLAIATLAQSLCHVSGAHLNPAITFAMLISCQISVFRAVLYILAQMVGAVFASGIVYGVRPSSADSLGVNKLNGVDAAQGFGIEFLATFQLVLCFIATTDKRRRDVTGSAPLAIGLSVALGHLAAISYTGCGINPARSFGPAVIQKAFENHWVYWVGPISGGIVASLVYDFLLQPKVEDLHERLKVLCYGTEEAPAPEPLLEGTAAAQWAKGGPVRKNIPAFLLCCHPDLYIFDLPKGWEWLWKSKRTIIHPVLYSCGIVAKEYAGETVALNFLPRIKAFREMQGFFTDDDMMVFLKEATIMDPRFKRKLSEKDEVTVQAQDGEEEEEYLPDSKEPRVSVLEKLAEEDRELRRSLILQKNTASTIHEKIKSEVSVYRGLPTRKTLPSHGEVFVV